ncbi:MAG: DUF1206 domain-containing protein, partial [Ilumatobacter sp.]
MPAGEHTETMGDRGTRSASESAGKAADSVADSVDDAVDDNPWVERLTQWGWIAKAAVYTLMGLTALQIARQSAPDDEASPEGSIGRVSEAPLGRAVLVVLTVGLVLYSVWRILSVAVIHGNELSDWAERIGYSFSAVFYLLLAWTAGKAVLTGVQPEKSNSVESLSKSLLEMTAGRWLLGAVGLGTIAVGLYFIVHKGIQRSFADDLDGVSATPRNNGPKRRALLISGMIGWIGRGIVTGLVGYFVVRSAVRFDPDDARGFDRTLRQVAGTSL